MQRNNLQIKTRGLNNILSPFEVGEKGFLTQADNIDISNELRYRRRKGYIKKVSGNIHSLWSDGDICLYREGQYLKRLLEDYSSVTLRSDFTTEKRPMAYLSLLNKVYYSDGIVNGIIENGLSRSWGLDIPSYTLSGSGEYQVALVYRREDGQISGSGRPQVGGGGITNISKSNDPTVKYIDIYATTKYGEALYYCKSIPNGTTSASVSEGEIKSSLPLLTVNLNKPPVGDILEYYNGRIYIANGNIIWYTEPFAYELCNLSSNYIMFEDAINLVIAVKDGLWVATDRKTYFMLGDSPPFKIFPKAEYGAVKGTSQKVSGEYFGLNKPIFDSVAIWLSNNGICIGLDNGQLLNITENYYSFPIARQGSAIFRRGGGINQFIISLKDISNAENLYN